MTWLMCIHHLDARHTHTHKHTPDPYLKSLHGSSLTYILDRSLIRNDPKQGIPNPTSCGGLDITEASSTKELDMGSGHYYTEIMVYRA